MNKQSIDKKEILERVRPLQGKNLLGIAKDENIGVFLSDLDGLELNPTPSGLIMKTQESYKILIHNGCNIHRKRFTLAHELGHYFLHKDYLDDKKIITDDDNTLYHRPGFVNIDEYMRKMEREANFFAAELLMPEDTVRAAYKIDGDIEKLASFFNVSVTAMAYRLENLSIIKHE